MAPFATAAERLLALGGELLPDPSGARRKYDLAHMRTLLRALGSPHTQFPSVLIAGTNGKGSTAATLASILQAAGTRTGLYTSPHLEQPHERIRIQGHLIPEDTLTRLLDQVEAAAARLIEGAQLPAPPSFFETVTAIAFLHFAEQRVELAVLEVGMGGRLDATNVVEPLISVITDISADHMQWLGDSLAAITREKCGILRRGGWLVTLPQHPEVNQTIGEVAVPLGVQAINAAEYLPQSFERPQLPSRGASSSNSKNPPPAGAALPQNSGNPAAPAAPLPQNSYTLVLPRAVLGGASVRVASPLAGSHQTRNLALAIATAGLLHTAFHFPLIVDALEEGIRATTWPARLQSVELGAGRAPLLLDAAHNPAGAWTLRAALSGVAEGAQRRLIFGCMADKAIDELAQILFPIFDEVLLTAVLSSRAAPLSTLAAAAEPTGTPFRSYTRPEDALLAAQLATPSSGLIVVAGSIALLGEILALVQSDVPLE